MVQEISHVNSQNKYIIPNCRNSKEKRELKMQANIKMKNSKNLKVKTRIEHLLYETLTETTLVQPIILSLPLDLLHVASLRY